MNLSSGRANPSGRSASRKRFNEARYRKAACLLADIGWRAHPEYRGTQSLNIIAHAAFLGVDHPGRAYLALTNLFRHEGLFSGLAPAFHELATPRYLERARILAGAMRVVYLLSAAMPGVIPQLRWRKRDDGVLALVIPKISPAFMAKDRPRVSPSSEKSWGCVWFWLLKGNRT